jgi:small subunit ribosomal protein S1
VQYYDDSRSQSLGAATTEPEPEAQRTELASSRPTADANAGDSAVPRHAPSAAETDTDEAEPTMASLLESPSHTMHALQRGEVIEGIVARIDADEVLVDIGQKSEGVISSRELGPSGESGALRVGQRVLVYVMQPESAEGHAILSLKRARMEQSWRASTPTKCWSTSARSPRA